MTVQPNSIAYLKRAIEGLKFEEQRLSVLIFGSPHEVEDLQTRLKDIRRTLHELTGQLEERTESVF